MARTKNVKVTKSLAVIRPVVERPTEEYYDYTTALIRYGLLMFRKTQGDTKLLEGEVDSLYDAPIPLTGEQVGYLNMRMQGLSMKNSCQLLKIDMAYPLLWEEELGIKSVYGFCLEAVKRTQAINLEDVVWDKAMTDDSKGLMAMFALKSRMSEYKDNAPANNNTAVQVNISVNGNKYVVDTDVVDIECSQDG